MLQDASRESPSRSVVLPLRTVSSCGIGELGQAKQQQEPQDSAPLSRFLACRGRTHPPKKCFFLGEYIAAWNWIRPQVKECALQLKKPCIFGLGAATHSLKLSPGESARCEEEDKGECLTLCCSTVPKDPIVSTMLSPRLLACFPVGLPEPTITFCFFEGASDAFAPAPATPLWSATLLLVLSAIGCAAFAGAFPPLDDEIDETGMDVLIPPSGQEPPPPGAALSRSGDEGTSLLRTVEFHLPVRQACVRLYQKRWLPAAPPNAGSSILGEDEVPSDLWVRMRADACIYPEICGGYTLKDAAESRRIYASGLFQGT